MSEFQGYTLTPVTMDGPFKVGVALSHDKCGSIILVQATSMTMREAYSALVLHKCKPKE